MAKTEKDREYNRAQPIGQKLNSFEKALTDVFGIVVDNEPFSAGLQNGYDNKPQKKDNNKGDETPEEEEIPASSPDSSNYSADNSHALKSIRGEGFDPIAGFLLGCGIFVFAAYASITVGIQMIKNYQLPAYQKYWLPSSSSNISMKNADSIDKIVLKRRDWRKGPLKYIKPVKTDEFIISNKQHPDHFNAIDLNDNGQIESFEFNLQIPNAWNTAIPNESYPDNSEQFLQNLEQNKEYCNEICLNQGNVFTEVPLKDYWKRAGYYLLWKNDRVFSYRTVKKGNYPAFFNGLDKMTNSGKYDIDKDGNLSNGEYEYLANDALNLEWKDASGRKTTFNQIFRKEKAGKSWDRR